MLILGPKPGGPKVEAVDRIRSETGVGPSLSLARDGDDPAAERIACFQQHVVPDALALEQPGGIKAA